MKCPECKNDWFKPNEEYKKPLVNIGGKVHYDTVDFRCYVCLQFGYRFYTRECYSHPIGKK